MPSPSPIYEPSITPPSSRTPSRTPPKTPSHTPPQTPQHTPPPMPSRRLLFNSPQQQAQQPPMPSRQLLFNSPPEQQLPVSVSRLLTRKPITDDDLIEALILIDNITTLNYYIDNTLKTTDDYERSTIIRIWYDIHDDISEESNPLDSKTLSNKKLVKLKSSPIKSNNEIDPYCYNKFNVKFEDDTNKEFFETNAGKKYKRIINKLKRVCTRFVNKEGCSLVSLDNKYKELIKKCPNRKIVQFNITEEHNENILLAVYSAYIDNPKIFLRRLNDFNINYIKKDEFKEKTIVKNDNDNDTEISHDNNAAIDAGGPSRQFAQNLAEQLLIRKIFIPVDEFSETNKTYKFNFNFNLNEFNTFAVSIGKNGKLKLDKFYKFIGSLVAWLMINGIKCRFEFNKGILAHMLYKPSDLDLDDYIVLYLLDNPSNEQDLMKAVADPSKLDESMFYDGDNTDYGHRGYISNLVEQIRKKPAQVTTDNYREFMGKYCKYKMMGYSQNNIHIIVKKFYEGFFIGRRWLTNRDYTIQQLNVLLFAKELDKYIIDELISFIQKNSDAKLESLQTPHEKRYYQNILKAFYKIFRKEIPYKKIYNRLTEVFPEDTNLIPDKWEDFMSSLFHYWTGIKNYYVDKTNNNYVTYNITLAGNNAQLVESHTCAYNLSVPRNITSKNYDFNEELYFILCKSILLDKKINGAMFTMA